MVSISTRINVRRYVRLLIFRVSRGLHASIFNHARTAVATGYTQLTNALGLDQARPAHPRREEVKTATVLGKPAKVNVKRLVSVGSKDLAIGPVGMPVYVPVKLRSGTHVVMASGGFSAVDSGVPHWCHGVCQTLGACFCVRGATL